MWIKQGNNMIAAGTATRDAEYKTVGDNSTPLTSFSLAINARGEEGKFLNCKAFGSVAGSAKGIKKGDNVSAWGFLETREHNEKAYNDLICQFVGVNGKTQTQEARSAEVANDYEELDDLDESELPF